MPKKISWLASVGLTLVLGGAGCASGVSPTPRPTTQTSAPTPAPAAAITEIVTIKNFAFVPASFSIHVGDTVTWRQNDSVPHTVAFSDGTTSPLLSAGQEYSRTFTKPGHYDYHCSIHPSMVASIDVQ